MMSRHLQQLINTKYIKLYSTSSSSNSTTTNATNATTTTVVNMKTKMNTNQNNDKTAVLPPIDDLKKWRFIVLDKLNSHFPIAYRYIYYYLLLVIFSNY